MMQIGGTSKAWSKDEIRMAAHVYRNAKGPRKAACQRVADAIGRTWQAVSKRLTDRGTSFDGDSRRAHRRAMEGRSWIEPPARAISERDYRADLQHASLTAAYCGDPKPGYSMLDRRERIAQLPPRPKISAVQR